MGSIPEQLKNLYIAIINWQEYIVSDRQVLLGKPTIKGTRISVELVLELFSTGWTEKQILDSYPSVSDKASKPPADAPMAMMLRLGITQVMATKIKPAQTLLLYRC